MKCEYGLKHIAVELHLSLTAVSRALLDCNDISDETKLKVWKKALQIGYVSPTIVKKRSKETKTIALFVDSLRSPYFGMIIEKMIVEFKKYGYKVLIIPTNNGTVSKDNVVEAINANADAILTFLLMKEEAYVFASLYMIPMLLFGRYFDASRLDVFYMDDEDGAHKAVDYLLNVCGSKKLCYISVEGFEVNERRKAGFVSASTKADVPFKVIDEKLLDNEINSLIKDGYDGYFCFDDQLANYLLSVIKDEQKIHVVGFNGASRFYEYPYDITSIEADYDQMVANAVVFIIEKIKKGGPRLVKKFPVTLYIGKS